jgi:hypothetical protein
LYQIQIVEVYLSLDIAGVVGAVASVVGVVADVGEEVIDADWTMPLRWS